MADVFPPTGRYDDLLMILARSEERRMQGVIPVKTWAGRVWWEPFWNSFGVLLASVFRVLPADLAGYFNDRLFAAIISGKKSYPFDVDSRHIGEVEALCAEARRRTGASPALFCITSHPPAYGPLLYLNVELVRHALWALRRLRGRPCRPRLVIAMDYYALDMLAHHEEALYAGFTGRYHLGFDRLVHLRPGIGRWLLGRVTGWPDMASRVIGILREGGEAAMVLGGGIPGTSRVYYCAREFVGRMYRERPAGTGPEDIRRRLLRAAPDFARFLDSGVMGPSVRGNIRRMMEAWVLAGLTEDQGLEDVDAGKPTAACLEAVESCARALGWEGDPWMALLRDFREEFRRETPYRERLFGLLARRVAGRGIPMVLVPLTHGTSENVAMQLGEPVCLMGFDNGRIRWMTANGEPRHVTVRDFCREFVSARYS